MGVQIIWDLDDDADGNVQHVLLHDLTREEVDEVLQNPDNPTDRSRSSDRTMTFGWTSTGRYIAVVWEEVLDDPRTVYPLTAYDVPAKE